MARLKQFYANGIVIGDRDFSLECFLRMALRINGTSCPRLADVCATVGEVLDSKRLCRMPTAFGLGDAHRRSILVRKGSTTVNSAHHLLHIDYEVGGFHSPTLDLVKPVYYDILANQQSTDVSYQAGKLVINLDPCNLICIRGITDIKFRYLLEPLSALLEQHETTPEAWVTCLAHGLFVYALLLRNFNNQWDALFTNVAIGVQLINAWNLTKLRQRFDSLIRPTTSILMS